MDSCYADLCLAIYTVPAKKTIIHQAPHRAEVERQPEARQWQMGGYGVRDGVEYSLFFARRSLISAQSVYVLSAPMCD